MTNADICVSEVCAELLGLHPLPPGEAAAEALVDVAVAALSALVT